MNNPSENKKLTTSPVQIFLIEHCRREIIKKNEFTFILQCDLLFNK